MGIILLEASFKVLNVVLFRGGFEGSNHPVKHKACRNFANVPLAADFFPKRGGMAAVSRQGDPLAFSFGGSMCLSRRKRSLSVVNTAVVSLERVFW